VTVKEEKEWNKLPDVEVSSDSLPVINILLSQLVEHPSQHLPCKLHKFWQKFCSKQKNSQHNSQMNSNNNSQYSLVFEESLSVFCRTELDGMDHPPYPMHGTFIMEVYISITTR